MWVVACSSVVVRLVVVGLHAVVWLPWWRTTSLCPWHWLVVSWLRRCWWFLLSLPPASYVKPCAESSERGSCEDVPGGVGGFGANDGFMVAVVVPRSLHSSQIRRRRRMVVAAACA